MEINLLDAGRMEYGQCLALQYHLHAMRNAGKIRDTLIVVEHPAVLTMGIRGDEANIYIDQNKLNQMGVSIYKVKRGGDVTYHGPGQIVGYPIIHLKEAGMNLREYLVRIQILFVELLLQKYGIEARTEDRKHTGVWVRDRKITAIGVQLQHMITMHGFAYNVNTDMRHFEWINPCGLSDRKPVSLEQLLGHSVDFRQAKNEVCEFFAKLFHAELIEKTQSEIECNE